MEIHQKYKGVARFRVPEPWYKKTTGEPWDETKANWLTDNKYRRLIISALADGPKTKRQLEKIFVTLSPRLTKQKEQVKISISPTALQNHLDNLTWYGLISHEKGKYQLNFPLLKFEQVKALDLLTERLALKLAEAISQNRQEIIKVAENPRAFEKLIDPLLEKVVEETLAKLEQQGEISYGWETYHRWIEEFDIEEFRTWARKANKKGKTKKEK